MNVQTFLLLLIAAMIGIHWYPSAAYPVIVILVIGYLLNEFPKWLKQQRLERAKQKQLDDDAPLRQEFWRKHKAIRFKYDPNDEWNEATSLPAAYRQEMEELNEQYRVVLDRWNNQ